MIRKMEMPVSGGEDYGPTYGENAEYVVGETLSIDYEIPIEYTDYHCPIDMIINGEYGAEIKYRAPNKTKSLISYTKKNRKHRIDYCRNNGLKPLTIVVYPIEFELVEITFKKGIKNVSNGFRGDSLEVLVNAMVINKKT